MDKEVQGMTAQLDRIMKNRTDVKKGDTQELVESILESYAEYPGSTRLNVSSILNRDLLIDILGKIREILFPGFYDKNRVRAEYVRYIVGEKLEYVQYHLTKQVAIALGTQELCEDCEKSVLLKKAEGIVDEFLHKIPRLREILATDIQAAYDGDPAAYSTDEIILSYPGLMAISIYRIAHELWVAKVPLIPRVMTEYAHRKTGIDIHPGATIGSYFFIDHGTGVVVGETTEIGTGAKIYQGVTLGALSTRGGQNLRNTKRHPTLEDNVTVYSGASILGGDTVIGEGAIIGSNAFITSSVPGGTRVSIKNPELQFKDRVRMTELGQEGFWKGND